MQTIQSHRLCKNKKNLRSESGLLEVAREAFCSSVSFGSNLFVKVIFLVHNIGRILSLEFLIIENIAVACKKILPGVHYVAYN